MTARAIPGRAGEETATNWSQVLASGGAKNKAQSLLVTGMAAFEAYNKARDWYRTKADKKSYMVTLQDTSELYFMAHAWLIDRLNEEDRRSFVVDVRRSRKKYRWEDDAPVAVRAVNARLARQRQLKLVYDGSKNLTVNIDGYPIVIAAEQPEIPSANENEKRIGKPGTFIMKASSPEGQRAVINLLQQFARELDEAEVDRYSVYSVGKYGGWEEVGSKTPRPLNTVILDGTQNEDFIEDVEWFLSSEERYTALGLPWHRGYILDGPPGTGKTSMAQAVAGHFDMEVYYLPLADLRADADLISLMGSIPNQLSMLLLEDIDVLTAAKDRKDGDSKDAKERVSMTGLLNALDGIVTPHGLITVMTTNDYNSLDDAIVRPGRADRRFHMGYVTNGQARRLITQMTGKDPGRVMIGNKKNITPGEIVEVVKTNMHVDATDIHAAIRDKLHMTMANSTPVDI